MKEDEKKEGSINKSLKASFINFFSILHIIFLFFGTSFYIISLDAYPGMTFVLTILGILLLLVAGLMAFAILIQKEKNLFNKISSLITLSVIGLIIIISISF